MDDKTGITAALLVMICNNPACNNLACNCQEGRASYNLDAVVGHWGAENGMEYLDRYGSVEQEQKKPENVPYLESEELPDIYPDLTEEEKLFLKEHLYGQWRFSERIAALDESKNIYYNTTYNISDTGVEELKKLPVKM